MKKTFLRILIVGLLLISCTLAITQQRLQGFYPMVEVEVIDPAKPLSLSLLFHSRPTLHDCEALTGNIVRVTLKRCPQCRIRLVQCEDTLDEARQDLFTDVPLTTASGRMANGAIVFHAANQELALAACRATEALSAGEGDPVRCFPANTTRPQPDRPPIALPQLGLSLLILLAAAFGAWLVCWLIIKYEHLHAHFSHDHIGSGPQKYHTEPTPRIGGLAVMIGLLAAGGTMLFADIFGVEREFGLLLIACIPAFLGGLVEDITKKVGVIERLLLTMLSGAVAAWLLGAVLGRLDIPGIDQALLWLPFAVVFTAFAVGGVANSINIIDGYHGLAGGFAVIVLVAMAYVAHVVGDLLVFSTSLALAGALLGFMVWNWPGGRIFLGDGGAYLVGFILAELSVLLVIRNPNVSPWFPLLLLIYPIFETFYSIWRRKFQNKLSPGQPDNHHLHQLVHDRLIPNEIVSSKRLSRNSRVAKYFWVPTAVLAMLGGLLWESTPMLIACAVGFCIIYVANYRRIKGMASNRPDSAAPAVSP